MEKIEIIIIGGGPAAITVAKNIGTKKQVALIRPEDHSMIYCAMPYAIEGIMNIEKTLKKDSIVTDAGAALIRDFVTKVDFDNKIVETKSGASYKYEKLIIASGANPIIPPIEGTDISGVMTFKTEDDLKDIMEQAKADVKEAVVVGAGAIGIELAQALNAINIKTYLVDMFDSILPNMMDANMIAEVQYKLEQTGISLHLGERVTKLIGSDYVESLSFASGNSLHFKSKPLIIFAVGMRPSIEIFKDTRLEIGKTGIIVDGYMKTNVEDVYAVGDCCEFKSALTGNVVLGKMATNAVPMGRLLAKNLLGDRREYKGFYNGAATKVGDFFVGSTGLSEKSAEENGYDYVTGKVKMTTAFPIMPSAKPVEVKLIADKKSQKILGGQIVSGEPVTDKIDQITMAVQFGISVKDLVQLSYSSQPYQSFYPANNLLVQAAELIVKQFS